MPKVTGMRKPSGKVEHAKNKKGTLLRVLKYLSKYKCRMFNLTKVLN